MSSTISPKEYAERLGVGLDKVLLWVKSGELPAINVSNGTRRPRYRIRPCDIEAFEQRRLAVQPPCKKTKRRPARSDSVKEFFK